MAGGEVIMSIARHASRAMPSRYFHVRMEAKRRDQTAAVIASTPTSQLTGLAFPVA